MAEGSCWNLELKLVWGDFSGNAAGASSCGLRSRLCDAVRRERGAWVRFCGCHCCRYLSNSAG